MTVTQGGAVHPEPRGVVRQPGPADAVWRVMTRCPVDVPPEATVREVAQELADGEIGAVLVADRGGVVGLVSERDLVGAVAAGDDPDDRQVLDLMSTDLVTARSTESIAAVAALMDEAAVRHVVVLDDAAVVGLVSVRDVLPALLRSR